MNTHHRQPLNRRIRLACLLTLLSLSCLTLTEGQSQVSGRREIVSDEGEPQATAENDNWIIADNIEKLKKPAVKLRLEALKSFDKLLYTEHTEVSKARNLIPRNIPGMGVAVFPLAAALRDPDETNAARAAYILGSLGAQAKDAVPALRAALKDKRTAVRNNAADALGKIGSDDKETISALVELFEDKTDIVRLTAVEALIKLKVEANVVVPAAINLLSSEDAEIRHSAANTLYKLGPSAKDAVPALRIALKDKDPIVRYFCAVALGGIGPEARAAVPELIELLNDQAASYLGLTVRGRAAAALGDIGLDAKVAIPGLIKLLHDKDIYVHSDSAEALAKISASLQKAKNTEAVNSLRTAAKALEESNDPNVHKYADTVKGNADYLELLWWEWLGRWPFEHPYKSLAMGVYPLLLLVCLALLWLRPVWLLHGNEVLLRIGDLRLPGPLGNLGMPLRYLAVIGFFHYHPRVLDAWVAQHSDSARHVFAQYATVAERDVHVPVPVALDAEGGAERRSNVLANLTPETLRPVFARKQACLLIWGDGGTGKTSLACLLARWALDELAELRLCRHVMLPILIEQGEVAQIGGEDDFLNVVRQQLKLLAGAADHSPTALVRRLLQRQRLLVIVDGMSEMSKETRAKLVTAVARLSVNACLMTARGAEACPGLLVSHLSPRRISGNKLATFMEAYLNQTGKRELFNDEEFFDGCRRLSLIVRDREITALLAKSYAEQMIATREGATNDELPTNIPDLMLNYVNLINRQPAPDAPDIRAVHRTAQAAAWACLQQSYRPATARYADVLAALDGAASAPLLDYLEQVLKLIRVNDAGREHLQFTLDPLAEYLAGLHLVRTYSVNESAWREFLHRADEQEGAPDTIRGFLLAVRDCCLSKEREYHVPAFVATEIARRVGLATGG